MLKVQHIINVYKKIKQPEIWAQWIRNQVNLFKEGSITMCQRLINKALVIYNRIISDVEHRDVFHSSINTLQQDIVVILAKAKATKVKQKVLLKKPPCNYINDNASSKPQDLPQSVKWFKSPTAQGSVEYKVGDTKEYKGKS